jgi:hypothetical protein
MLRFRSPVWCLRERYPSTEDRTIAAARNLQYPGFIDTICSEVAFESLPDLSSVDSDDVVVAGVVVRSPPKDRTADLLFVKIDPSFDD